MRTREQVEAARRNGALSKGRVTEAGKPGSALHHTVRELAASLIEQSQPSTRTAQFVERTQGAAALNYHENGTFNVDETLTPRVRTIFRSKAPEPPTPPAPPSARPPRNRWRTCLPRVYHTGSNFPL